MPPLPFAQCPLSRRKSIAITLAYFPLLYRFNSLSQISFIFIFHFVNFLYLRLSRKRRTKPSTERSPSTLLACSPRPTSKTSRSSLRNRIRYLPSPPLLFLLPSSSYSPYSSYSLTSSPSACSFSPTSLSSYSSSSSSYSRSNAATAAPSHREVSSSVI